MKSLHWLMVPTTLSLAACAGTMTGLDGQSGFACKAPDGISCASLSGVYANAVQNNLPGQRSGTKPDKLVEATARINAVAPRSGDPLRSAQKVRRVWFAPWEDEEEVLHDQSYVYLVIDRGHWQVEHSRRQASDGFRPVLPPNVPSRMLAPQTPTTGDRQSPQKERMELAPGATPAFNAAGTQSLPMAPVEVE